MVLLLLAYAISKKSLWLFGNNRIKMEQGNKKRTSAQIKEINRFRRRLCICGCAECIRIFAHWTHKQHDKFCGYVTIPGYNQKDTNLAKYKTAYWNVLYWHITGLVRTKAPQEKDRQFRSFHHFVEEVIQPNNKGPLQCFVASEEYCVKQHFSDQNIVRYGTNKGKYYIVPYKSWYSTVKEEKLKCYKSKNKTKFTLPKPTCVDPDKRGQKAVEKQKNLPLNFSSWLLSMVL